MTATTTTPTPTPTPNPYAARQYVTPEGAPIELIHLTGTDGGNRPGRRDGGIWDGWRVTVRHPVTRYVISDTWLGATVPEAELDAALTAVGAVRVDDLPRPPRRRAGE